jgi:transposase-like protein
LEIQEKLERPSRRPRRKFSDGFKRDAVEIVNTSGKSIAQVARELGIYDSTLGNWVKQDEINRGVRDGVSTTEREEIVALRRENAHLRMERELLKRAVAFWVRESDE